ncbi:MAG: hypothetical protein ACXVIY_13780 [Mucilaginibacter sp.]
MVMFWGKLIDRLAMPTNYRLILGGLLLVYSIIRFLRFFRRRPDEV